MAVRFGGPVSDTEEVSLRAGAIPNNTKATTDWGIRVWDEWAASRATTIAGVHGIVPLTTPLLDIPHVDLAYIGWENLFWRCARTAVSTHRNLCMLSFVASNAFLSKMVSTTSILSTLVILGLAI